MLTTVNQFGTTLILAYFWPMNEKNYSILLYFITGVIAITLGMQIYWNYKNYLASKQQLVNEVQISLDNAVDAYYKELAEENVLGVSFTGKEDNLSPQALDSILMRIDKSSPTHNKHTGVNVVDSGKFKSISIFSGDRYANMDTLFKKISIDNIGHKRLLEIDKRSDSIGPNNPFFELTTRVIFAMTNDSLELQKVDSLVSAELVRKNIAILYDLAYLDEDGILKRTNTSIPLEHELQTTSKSSYLPKKTSLQLTFTNATITILRRNVATLLLSFLFAAAIIGCLLYLLRIIKQQKQLAEVKNDLISNITHEFKTPIATIGAAMESIQKFNPQNDAKKNERYAQISSTQVEKLNTMVEKLLETATLDSEQLSLNIEEINIVDLVRNSTNKEVFITNGKTITFDASTTEIFAKVDVFHFENAINNILDNAIKYGGDQIYVSIKKEKKAIQILISDTGNTLQEVHKKQIFEKFYRVPKGNTHDVKGFGIGLYYAKTIIEKHHGALVLTLHPTTFKISLPNA